MQILKQIKKCITKCSCNHTSTNTRMIYMRDKYLIRARHQICFLCNIKIMNADNKNIKFYYMIILQYIPFGAFECVSPRGFSRNNPASVQGFLGQYRFSFFRLRLEGSVRLNQISFTKDFEPSKNSGVTLLQVIRTFFVVDK